jgi:glycosyltransferase involved in cell wall biosynthesis
MNIGWVSAPISATTGYGLVSRNICFRLADLGYDVVNIGGRGTTVVYGEKIVFVSPKGKRVLSLPAWGFTGDKNTIEYYIQRYKLDVIISLFDAFALGFGKPSKPWAAYIPIDAPLTKKWYNYLTNPDVIVAMSNFGKNELLKFFPPFMIDYIPHGVDTTVFKPVSKRGKAKFRKLFNIPEDKFVALFVGANMGERKCIPQLMIAFKRFLEKHPDSLLYLMTALRNRYPEGYDLIAFAEELGISDKVLGPAFNVVVDPLDETELAKLYACADVLVLPSFGEGFGLPIIEAQSSGVPVIATKSSSIIELVEGHGWLIETVSGDEWIDVPVWIPLLAQYNVPKISSIVEMLCDAYENPSKRAEYAEKSREFALQYDWDNIMPKWRNLIDETLANIP